MSIATLIPLVIQLSLALMVFSIALSTRLEDLTYLFRRPKLLLRSLLSMNVVMPVVAVALAKGFDLTPVVKGSLVLLAISPLPPVFPNKAMKAGGERSYTIGLLVAATLLSIVFIPVALEILERAFGIPLQMSPAAVVALVFWTLLLPLALGVGVHRMTPAFAERAGKPIALVGTFLLILALLPVLIKVWPAMMSLIGNGTILVMVVFALVGLAVGHLLGGPDVEQRTVLALSTATRHPGIAIAIAAVNFPDQRLAPAAILLYL
ncbi:MAG: bile acid:sodium symporter family protein, partial [Gemmatimonadales bacterium]